MNKTSVKIKEEVKVFLEENIIAVIATTGKRARPQAATIHYLMDDDWNFYFVTRKNTRKFDNLNKNSRVALVVGTVLAPKTVQIEGKAKLLEGRKDVEDFRIMLSKRRKIRGMYLGKHSGSPFTRIPGLDLVLFKVKVDWLRWMNIDKMGEEKYYQIIGK